MLRGHLLARLILVLAASATATLVGCKRDLGECSLYGVTADGAPLDGPAAFDIAYRVPDGLPMYEGQALVQSTCGNGQLCHSPAAVGSDRVGVPAGLNFDVALACTGALQDPTCAPPLGSCEGGQTDTDYCQRLQRLQSNNDQIIDWADGMIQEIRAGAMPPGEVGRDATDPRQWLRKSDGTVLPTIESSEGREIVRNWLACEAPVVARTEFPPSDALELEPCESVDDEICIYNGPRQDLPDPTWSDIYWSLMFTQCVVCHGPANGNVDENPANPFSGQIPGGASAQGLAALNLTGSDAADTTNWASESWAAVVGALAADPGSCAGQGTIVIPNDPANSIMIQKISATQTCGDSMPLGTSVGFALIQVVEAWINLGAPND
jgi:hypothetical protein